MKTNDLLSLKDKVAIVTGGGNGIGRGSSLMLAAHGATVVVADLNTENARRVVEEIENQGGSALAVSCNVTKDEDLVALVDKTVETFGGIHVLVNNAGGGGAGRESPLDIDVEQFAGVFQLNVFSIWRLCQLCAPHMKKAGYGSIVNMSSMSSINKSPAISAYASSKAAVNHMTANLAHDYGPEIRINAVGPGAVRTDALASVLTPEREKEMLKHTPLERLGEVEDIAGAVLYFAAPISKWVSGQVLFVNGGGVQTLD
ncbi:glucose 1-dehydrogenase [Pistricoccus aurantiacus]|uniref:Glucose 1-dehydrogenase n=1 Tax=Pistricoccus aurantiacus TaxID=1883414 RepID=A0A5B8SQ03_9GAMM|nr:glucose 1-dehydrogenase [Pistricoccus aurantiacus]QEA38274.1 glucose 1-dehydrogenase [Pistricoccus aurantiacus]